MDPLGKKERATELIVKIVCGWRDSEMGSNQSGEVLKKGPLGCILRHWKEIEGSPGDITGKRTLIKYYNHW